MRKVVLTFAGCIALCALTFRAQNAWGQTGTAAPELFGSGVFSTGHYELPPTMTADGQTAFFTISTPAYGRFHTIMTTQRMGTGWIAPRIASFSGHYSDADPMISPDGSKLFFLSRRPTAAREATRRDFDIWYVTRSSTGWTNPTHVAAASGPDEEHYVSPAASGALYIAAIRSDSKGRGDIYRVPFKDGVYGPPENLGPNVNSPDHHDTTPYVAPDESYLIFGSSGRPDGHGSAADLYISFNRNGAWTPAQNLGALTNTTRTEYCPIVNSDGYLYFTSDRGFADSWPTGALTTERFNAAISSPGNGLGDTYRIPLKTVLEFAGSR